MEIAWIAAPLLTDLEELASFASRLNHAAGSIDGVRHRGLTVDVQPHFQARDRLLGVTEIGRRDQHRMEILLLFEHLTVVHVAAGFVAIAAQQATDALEIQIFPDVTDRRKTNPGIGPHLDAGVQQHLSLRAGPDQCNTDVTAAVIACHRMDRRRKDQTGPGGRRRTKKTPPVHQEDFLLKQSGLLTTGSACQPEQSEGPGQVRDVRPLPWNLFFEGQMVHVVRHDKKMRRRHNVRRTRAAIDFGLHPSPESCWR